MATTRGCFGQVSEGANVIAELRTWELTENAERIDASVMGNCVKKYVTGAVEASGTFTTFLDETDAAQLALVTGAEVTLTLLPAGPGSGLPSRVLTAIVEVVDERASVDSLVERDYTYVMSGGSVDRTAQA